MYFSYILDVFLTFFVATTQYTIELVYLYLSMCPFMLNCVVIVLHAVSLKCQTISCLRSLEISCPRPSPGWCPCALSFLRETILHHQNQPSLSPYSTSLTCFLFLHNFLYNFLKQPEVTVLSVLILRLSSES